MAFRSLIMSLLVLGCYAGFAQQLSDESKIGILTIGPYQPELYSAFGHSAIRVVDPVNRIDWIFHYGVFDFNQKNFYTNFALGHMIYKIGSAKYAPYLAYYLEEDRHLRMQYLNLNLTEKQALFNSLLHNYRPENRNYLYNYVFDNCATRIRDVIGHATPAGIDLNESYVEKGKTIRDLMDDYLSEQPWGDFLIDLGLGMQIDREATSLEYMFLPDYIFRAFDGAEIIKPDGENRSLVAETVVINQPAPKTSDTGFLTPFNFFTLLFFVVGFLTHLDLKKERRTSWLDALLFGVTGFVGCWLLFLWFGTAHLSKYNLNLLWAIPLHLPAIALIGKHKWLPLLRKYLLYTGYFYILLFVVWAVLPQPLHMSLVPYVLTLMLRTFFIAYFLKRRLRPRRSSVAT